MFSVGVRSEALATSMRKAVPCATQSGFCNVFVNPGYTSDQIKRPLFEFIPTTIDGCYEIRPRVMSDHRGTFSKLFHSNTFIEKIGVDLRIHEVLFSSSNKGVLRGLHFQASPKSTAKLVACLSGDIFDAVVDLRPKSPTYLKTFSTRLSGDKDTMIYIPEGLAHGFYAYEDNSTILYMTSGVFSPEHDSGIHWNSAGIEWPDPNPIISDRDQNLVRLEGFDNPF